MRDSPHTLYRSSNQIVRATFGADRNRAIDYYQPLLDFVVGVQAPDETPGTTRLLDVGCGVGWSTFAFAHAGYDATGIDLNPQAFEPQSQEYCTLREGSGTDIPFPADSFDIVVCYQCLEHIPNPQSALEEMTRVCRPGGVVVIVGPNLVSPLPGIVFAIRPSSWKFLRLQRHPEMPRHPYGNTLPEILVTSVIRGFQLVSKMFRSSPQFTMRTPDAVPPFHADNDACYLCNPTDLISYFRSRGFRIIRRGKPGRLPLTYLLAGGTWVAAKKPIATGT